MFPQGLNRSVQAVDALENRTDGHPRHINMGHRLMQMEKDDVLFGMGVILPVCMRGKGRKRGLGWEAGESKGVEHQESGPC